MLTKFTLAAFAGSLMFGLPALAGETEIATIKAECAAQLGFSEAKCACIAERAGEDLNDTQQKFMVANITKNETAFAELQSSMSLE
jgi:hypothetical protein